MSEFGKSRKDSIINSHTYHPPKGDQVDRYKTIRDAGMEFSFIIAHNSPSTPEQTLALRKIEEAVMWANKAIACNE